MVLYRHPALAAILVGSPLGCPLARRSLLGVGFRGFPSPLCTLWRLLHLLQTLLNNAADASEAAGSERVALSIDVDTRRIAASVRDFGSGFEEAHPLSAGALFRTTKADGLGIGLALSHATVERLGGILSMQPADGGGTRVMFELPLARFGEGDA